MHGGIGIVERERDVGGFGGFVLEGIIGDDGRGNDK